MKKPFSFKLLSKESVSWVFYDFANSAYALLILSFVFPIYFKEVVVGGQNGDFWWGLAVSASILLGGLIAPFIGAMADYESRRKAKFIFFASMSMIGAASLFFLGPNMLIFGLLLFIVTNIFFEIAQTLYDSFLPQVSNEKSRGLISGLGWGLGYLGGIVAMLLLSKFYQNGYSEAGSFLYRLTFPLTALFFLICALPAFILIKEAKSKNRESLKKVALTGFNNTFKTLKEIKKHKRIAWFLVAFFLFNDALATIFAFIPIYAKTTLGFTFSEILTLLLIVQLVGFPSTIFFGWLSDKISHKKILLFTLVLWIIGIFGISIASSKGVFYALSILTGLVMGSSQAIARSWFSKIIPKNKTSEFFGFNGFASKVAATLGPILFGMISVLTGNQRIAMASMLIFFITSFIIFSTIKED